MTERNIQGTVDNVVHRSLFNNTQRYDSDLSDRRYEATLCSLYLNSYGWRELPMNNVVTCFICLAEIDG